MEGIVKENLDFVNDQTIYCLVVLTKCIWVISLVGGEVMWGRQMDSWGVIILTHERLEVKFTNFGRVDHLWPHKAGDCVYL